MSTYHCVLLRPLGQEDSLDVRQDSTLGDGDSGEQLVQLLVIPDDQLEMTGDDPGLLLVTGSVASQLEEPNCLLPSLLSMTSKQRYLF